METYNFPLQLKILATCPHQESKQSLLFLSKPIGYQVIDGEKHDISVSYDVLDSTTYGFSVEKYDAHYDLIIDPLIASTFIGGNDHDYGYSMAIDSSGNVYVTGETYDGSVDIPTTAGAYDTTQNGNHDVFVSKFNSALTSLSASTFIGGSCYEDGDSIAIDSSGNVYVTGETYDAVVTDFPTTAGAYNQTHNGGVDVFVSKFNGTLSTLSASTFIGGSGNDLGYSIAIDSSGNVYVTGKGGNAVTPFPTTAGAYDQTYNGGNYDVFVSKFNSALTSLSASTFIGGSSDEDGDSIAIDSSGNVYVTGETFDAGTDLPTTAGAYDQTANGNYDVFVSKFNGTLSTLSASTFIGGSSVDYGYSIAIDSSGNVYVTGITTDDVTDLPTTAGAYDTTQNGGVDVFVSKFNGTLSTLSASTFIGEASDDHGYEIALDSSGNVYVTGETASSGFPTTAGAYDTTYNTVGDVFVTRITGDLASAYSSTLSESLGISASVNTTLATIISTNVTAGVPVTKTLPAQGTLEVTLPSTNKVSFTLPSGISGDVTVVTTNSGSSAASISFLGTVVDFSTTASCATGCPVAFNFTQAELTTSGFSSSEIKVFHDSSGDGSFQTSEALTTTITTFSGGFTATASTPSTSKFAIGGVAGSVSANAAAGIGAAGSFLGLLKDNCDENGFGNGKSLRIYEISYDKCDANQITILADTTCGPMNVRVEKESSMNMAGMPSEQPYLHDEKRMIVLSSPITSDVMDFSIIAKDKRDEFYEKIYAEQCTGTKQYTFATGYTSEQSNAASPLLPDWIKNNAKWWSNEEIDDQTFVNGIQYLVKHNVITVEKNTPTENTDDTIPEWIKNNAKWWSNGEIDDQTFVNGIQYLVKVGAIKVN